MDKQNPSGSNNGSTEPKFNYPKSTLPDQVRQWDKFVAVGTVNGEPRLITSEGDADRAADLIQQFPQLSRQREAANT